MPIDPSVLAAAGDEVYATLLARSPELAAQFPARLRKAEADVVCRLKRAARQEDVSLDELPGTFQKSVANGVVNYALALTGAAVRERELRRQAALVKVRTALEWARARQEIDPEWSTLAFFEQWVIDGHPLHPGAKIRIGMTAEHVIRTCPEWGNTVKLAVAALKRGAVVERPLPDRASGLDSLTTLLRSEHPAVDTALRNHTNEPDSVVLLPVHPWQATEVLPRRYRTEIAAGIIRILPSVTIPARPLMSYRTVAPLPTSNAQHPSHLKTALSVQLTSAARGVSPNAITVGPEISRLMERILARENRFDGLLDVVRERAGAHFDGDSHQSPRSDSVTGGSQEIPLGETLSRSAALAALARDSPERHLRPDEVVLPVGALWAKSPLGGGSVIAELLDEACRSDARGVAAAAVQFVSSYARMCVSPLLTLLCRYGVALEAHGENTLLVISKGLPRRCLIRDFGAIRISRERLIRQDLPCDIPEDSPIAAKNPRALRQKLYFALFVNDASNLISCLTRASGVPAATLWGCVRSAARAAFDQLRQDERLSETVRADEAALMEQPWERKALLTMWLQRAVTDYIYVPTPNMFEQVAYD